MATLRWPRLCGRRVRIAKARHAVVPHAQRSRTGQQRGVRTTYVGSLTAQAHPLHLQAEAQSCPCRPPGDTDNASRVQHRDAA